MTVSRASIQADQCYLTVNGQVARVVQLLPDGRVHYQFRNSDLAKAFGWHSGSTSIDTFVHMVERPVPCDWMPEQEGQPYDGCEPPSRPPVAFEGAVSSEGAVSRRLPGMAFRTLFRRKLQPNPFEDQRLGPRSPFVLAKIGYDLREGYNDVVEQPLPEELQRAVEQLPEKPPLKPKE